MITLKLLENQLRFRIHRAEFDKLRLGETLALEMALFPEQPLTIILSPEERASSQLRLEAGASTIHLHISTQALQVFEACLPSRQGLEDTTLDTTGKPIRLCLEVDVRK